MMKRFLTWVFVFLMLLPCAFAEEGGGPRWQGFRDLPWGAIEEEIAEREGRVADRHLEISELCLDLVYSGMAYGDYAGAEAAYILYDGELVCAGYMIPGAEEEAMTVPIASGDTTPFWVVTTHLPTNLSSDSCSMVSPS